MPESTGQSSPRTVFAPAAIDDLRRIGPSATPRVLENLLVLESDPEAGHPLGEEPTAFRKLVVGKGPCRIVDRVTGTAIGICEIWAIGLRSDGEIYSEAAARAAKSSTPGLHFAAGALAG